VPFQCCRIDPFSSAPAAQALLAEVAATAVSTLLGAGLGLATCCHAVPFQRTIRVVVVAMGPKQWPAQPTAQALLAEVAATPNRAPPSLGVGLGPFGQGQQWTALIAALEDSLRLHRHRAGTLPGLGR
jgi:hypothetical protein